MRSIAVLAISVVGAGSVAVRPTPLRAVIKPSPAVHGAPPPPNRSPDFHANLGRAIDTLQREYPTLLAQAPSLDIFTDDVVAVDAHSGLKWHGREAYARMFAAMRWAAATTLERAEMGSLIVYDPFSSQIRVRWSAKLFRRWSTDKKPVHVDGVGVYSVDGTGHIWRHEMRSDAPCAPGTRHTQLAPGLALAGLGGCESVREFDHALAPDVLP